MKKILLWVICLCATLCIFGQVQMDNQDWFNESQQKEIESKHKGESDNCIWWPGHRPPKPPPHPAPLDTPVMFVVFLTISGIVFMVYRNTKRNKKR